jgi:dolichol-phosphate mannosyltransferase
MDEVTIVIAAYNEANSIAEVVTRCRQYGEVIVVDDASSDQTASIALRSGATMLRHSTNMHIKQSFVDGFRQALALNSRYIIQTDAGLSHNPDEIPKLLAPLKESADMTIGSRFIKGGMLVNQSMYRRLLSQSGSALVRFATSMSIVDLTSGFKGYKGLVLSRLDSEGVLSRLRSRAHAFQFELTNEIYNRGFTIKEVPITYQATNSSLDEAAVLEAIYIWLRLLLEYKR